MRSKQATRHALTGRSSSIRLVLTNYAISQALTLLMNTVSPACQHCSMRPSVDTAIIGVSAFV
jgi:hypothetical protein